MPNLKFIALFLCFSEILINHSYAEKNQFPGLPDFTNDRFNTVKDYLTGEYLTPKLSGEVFEWPTVSRIDWNNDGLFDLLVGYNLRTPDVIRMVVYINQGEHGKPAFTGKKSSDSCFYVEAIYSGEKGARIFEGDGYHVPHHPHNFIVHQTAPMDFDNDGLFDILLNEGMIDQDKQRGQWYLHNIGTLKKPQFKAYYLHDFNGIEGLPDGAYIQALELFSLPPFNSGLQSFSMLDWNSDGIADLQYSGSSTFLIFGGKDKNDAWYPQNEEWIEQKTINQNTFGNHPHMTAADFNLDGINELVVAHPVGRKKLDSDGYLSLYGRTNINSKQYAKIEENMFTLNGDNNPLFFPDFKWPFLFAKHGWWYPRVSAFDYDEDGDIDIIAGWGGGNGQRQFGDRIYLYRSSAASDSSGFSD